MDIYSKEAMKSYKDLMDLGMNVEVRHSGKLFDHLDLSISKLFCFVALINFS